MYLGLIGKQIFRRSTVSGWNPVRILRPNPRTWLDMTKLHSGSILAVDDNGELHVLASPSAPPDKVRHGPASIVSVTSLLDNSVLALSRSGSVFRARSPFGQWTQIDVSSSGLILTDLTTSPDGRLHLLGKDGALLTCNDPGEPTKSWTRLGPPPVGTVRVEYLRNGWMTALTSGGDLHLLKQPSGKWAVQEHCGQVQSLIQLGGETLLGIDSNHRFVTADALPDNWSPVAGPPEGVLALAHLPTGHIAVLGESSTIFHAPYSPGGFPEKSADWKVLTKKPPVELVTMTANPGGKIIAVGQDGRLLEYGRTGLTQESDWSPIDTGGVGIKAVTVLQDGMSLFAITSDGRRRLVRPPQTSLDVPPKWLSVESGDSDEIVSLSTIKDGSILEFDGGNRVRRRLNPKGKTESIFSCNWTGPCTHVIELASVPGDTKPRAKRWLLEFTSDRPDSVTGDGRPWGDGTKMALRARTGADPWDVGNRVTPLIGGYATLSAIRDAFEAAILDAKEQEHAGVAPGQRGHVYIVDWLLNALRDLSEDNPWGGEPWKPGQVPERDQTALGLIHRMMAAGIKVHILVWMPTTVQSRVMAKHARQHFQLACAIQDLNDRLCAQNEQWRQADPIGVCALDLRTAPNLTASLHQKMITICVGDVNIGFCGGVDLAFTRRDFGRPTDDIIGLGDWQSGTQMPIIQQGWPVEPGSPLSAQQFGTQKDEDAPEDELGDAVYGKGTGPHGAFRHWHDQHLKIEGPGVTTLQEQFDERWRLYGRVFTFDRKAWVYGKDDQVQFTSAKVYTLAGGDVTITPLTITTCDPVGDAVVQLWRTIPIDAHRAKRSPFGRGELTVMAGISKAVSTATQLITIWDQYFWSEPFCRLLAHRLNAEPGLQVLIVIPPHGSNDPNNELWYRRRAMQTLWKSLTSAQRQRVLVYNAWSTARQTGVYVHAKVQTYDDHLLVCGSANLNRRSFLCDMELDFAVLHKPSVSHHLANLAHMALGRPWTDFEPGWLGRFWQAMKGAVGRTMIEEAFFAEESAFRKSTPNGVEYLPSGIKTKPSDYTPESIFEPTSVAPEAETTGSDTVPGSPGPPGRLDQVVHLVEKHAKDNTFPYRQSK